MNIDGILNGYVIDHIRAGRAMMIYRYLGLDKLDCSVAIIKNAKSQRMGRKDIIKIDDAALRSRVRPWADRTAGEPGRPGASPRPAVGCAGRWAP